MESSSDEWESVNNDITRPLVLEPLVISLERKRARNGKDIKRFHIDQLCSAIAFSFIKNSWINNHEFTAVVLSIIPVTIQQGIMRNLDNLKQLVDFLRLQFVITESNYCNSLQELIMQTKSYQCSKEAISLIFCTCLRQLNIVSRLNFAIFPCWYYADPTIIDFDLYTSWVDIYSPSKSSWIAVDVVSGNIDLNQNAMETLIVNRCRRIESKSNKKCLSYVIAIDAYNNISDVTKRYANKYFGKSCKGRIKEWELILGLGKRPIPVSLQSIYYEEQTKLAELAVQEPMPTTISDLQSHPLFILEKNIPAHKLLKDKEIPVGKVRGINVYRKTQLMNLFPKEKWLKMGKSVKNDARPLSTIKRKKRSRSDLETETHTEYQLYSIEQVEELVPPQLVNGHIPKNKFNNIEIYHPNMVPIDCVHIPYKEAADVCRELGLEYVNCVVGFDFAKGGGFPIYLGVVAFANQAKIIMGAIENVVINTSIVENEIQIKEQQRLLRIEQKSKDIDAYLDTVFK